MSAPAQKPTTYVRLSLGDPAPWFRQKTSGGEAVFLDKTAGRYVVLCFFVSAADEAGAAAIRAVEAHRHLFDDRKLSFFGVSADKTDQSAGRLKESLPGVRFFLDFDAGVSRACGAIPRESAVTDAPVRRFWLVLDPLLRVRNVVPFAPDGADRAAIFKILEDLPALDRFNGTEVQAPVLFLPNVFEPELCETLIAQYEADGGTESGFMREVGGKTIVAADPVHKRRRDFTLQDHTVVEQTKALIARRIVPQIAKAFQFQVTRMERFIVACYRADEDGHFNAHRDNTTKGTAHRRFAVSLNLNDDYDGGELSFPEFGPRRFRPPAGAAVVFSCSLLHAADLVTRGKRYVFLPFLYDEAASAIRERNNEFLGPSVEQYGGS